MPVHDIRRVERSHHGSKRHWSDGQGIAAGEFAELLRAIRTGNSYVNVHNDKHPGGVIRAQLNAQGKGLIGSNHSHDKDDDEEDDD